MKNNKIVVIEHILKTLGNRKRLALLIYLFNGDASLENISNDLNLPYKTAGRNLINLLEAGFLHKRTSYNKVIFSLNTSSSDLHIYLINKLKAECSNVCPAKISKNIIQSTSK